MSIELATTLAPLPPCVRGTPYVLGKDPKSKNFLYTNGNNVVIRDIENPKTCDLYAEHVKPVTVAQYAPSGSFICSGDITGKIRIWATDSLEHKLKNEFPIFGGEVKDIAWSPDSTRISICGHGHQKHAAVIMWDSGNNVGKVIGSGKANSIDFKPTRPFKLIIADETSAVHYFTGPPFDNAVTKRELSKFAQCCRFSPDGKFFATCSSGGAICLYDGKNGEHIGQFLDGKMAHSGGVYCLSWNQDSSELLSASGDKTCKIWNVESREMMVKFEFGSTFYEQVVSCLWQGKHIVAATVSGDLHFLDRENPSTKRVMRGHKRAIWGLSTNTKDTNIFYTSDAEGKLVQWNAETGEAEYFKGKGYADNTKVSCVLHDPNSDKVISFGNDDKARFSCAESLEFGDAVDLGSQPKHAALMNDGYIVVLCHKELVVLKNGRKVSALDFDTINCDEPKSMAGHGTTVVIPKPETGFMLLDLSSDGSLQTREEVDTIGIAGPFSFSRDGTYLAAGQGNNTVRIYTTDNGFKDFTSLAAHSTRLLDISFSPDNDAIATTATDGHLFVSKIDKSNYTMEKTVHKQSMVNKLDWLDNETVITVGNDAVIKLWKWICD